MGLAQQDKLSRYELTTRDIRVELMPISLFHFAPTSVVPSGGGVGTHIVFRLCSVSSQ